MKSYALFACLFLAIFSLAAQEEMYPALVTGFGLNNGGVQTFAYGIDESKEPLHTTVLKRRDRVNLDECAKLPAFTPHQVPLPQREEFEVVCSGNLPDEVLESRVIGWTPIHAGNIQAVEYVDFQGDGLPEIVVSFPGYGLYIYSIQNKTWLQIHTIAPTLLSRVDFCDDGTDELVVYFPGYGLFYWEAGRAKWTLIIKDTIQALAWTEFDEDKQTGEQIVFSILSGAQQGTYAYYFEDEGEGKEAELWKVRDIGANLLATVVWNPEYSELVVAFAGWGVYWVWFEAEKQELEWQHIDSMVPIAMAGADLDGDGWAELILSYNNPVYAGVWIYREEPPTNGIRRLEFDWFNITGNVADFLAPWYLEGEWFQCVVGFSQKTTKPMGLYWIDFYEEEGDFDTDWYQLHTNSPSTARTTATYPWPVPVEVSKTVSVSTNPKSQKVPEKVKKHRRDYTAK